jgi:hypothetical protein
MMIGGFVPLEALPKVRKLGKVPCEQRLDKG